MKVLIVGSGGREHVLAWKIKQNSKVKKLYCAPGNAGIDQIAKCIDIKADDIEGLVNFAEEENIDLTVVGPEGPLAAGIVDVFEDRGLKIFGPRRLAARLEGSKAFAKDFMQRWNIPTGAYKCFNNAAKARDFLTKAQFPVVVKVDGLAAGKGVFICHTIAEGMSAVDQIMEQKIFKEAGNVVVIEEYLEGEEASILAVSDGKSYTLLESAQDHKRIFDDDLGPNTGGMGAYSPAPIINKAMLKKIEARIIEPTIRGMFREAQPFKGVLYAGLMITLDGPKVLEYNVRFGDPEIQAVLPRLRTDIVEVLMAACNEKLNKVQLDWDPRSCVSVVMSSGGYPGEYEIDKEISGLEFAERELDTYVFHAGTKKDENRIVTSGGRVLAVTSLSNTIKDAIKKTYGAVELIKFDRCFFRRDIGAKAIKRAQTTSRRAPDTSPRA